MKSERRHELEQNELAIWLAETAETIKPYTNIILAVTLVGVLCVAIYAWFSRQSRAEAAKASASLVSASVFDLEKLQETVDKYPKTSAGQLAAVTLADYYLAVGCAAVLDDRAMANQNLGKAIDLYKQALEHARAPLLRERATFGLARAYETRGELAQATSLYEQVLERWPKGAYSALASVRLRDIQRRSTREFYDRLASYEPKGRFIEGAGLPTDKPTFDPNSLREDSPVFTTPGSKLLLPGKEQPGDVAEGQKPSKPDVPTTGTGTGAGTGSEQPLPVDLSRPLGEQVPKLEGETKQPEQKPPASKPDAASEPGKP